jgi:hypothetical protein
MRFRVNISRVRRQIQVIVVIARGATVAIVVALLTIKRPGSVSRLGAAAISWDHALSRQHRASARNARCGPPKKGTTKETVRYEERKSEGSFYLATVSFTCVRSPISETAKVISKKLSLVARI